MMLQLALDTFGLKDAKYLLNEVSDIIDIVEIGTPLIIKEGIGAVRKIKNNFPFLRLLADLKIADGGYYESQLAFDAGADIVTVLGNSENETIESAVLKAKESVKEVMIDMINVIDVRTRAVEVEELDIDYICVHTASDAKSTKTPPLEELQTVKKVVNKVKIAIAGGIDSVSIDSIVKENPEIVIVGSWITKSENSREVAHTIKKLMTSG
jgi:3-hexulose-6-phosphate synthase